MKDGETIEMIEYVSPNGLMKFRLYIQLNSRGQIKGIDDHEWIESEVGQTLDEIFTNDI